MDDFPNMPKRGLTCLTGVILDTEFSWTPQIERAKLTILRNFFVLRRARPFIDQRTALLFLYNTMIRSRFDYCSTIWMKPDSGHLKKLQITKQGIKNTYLGGLSLQQTWILQ